MTTTMPAAFIGHGNPMNALETNAYTTAWSEFAASIERPRAIVAISAHWFVNVSAVTAMDRPRTIHDFFGFPDALFNIKYPAPGDPALAQQIVDLAYPGYVGLDADSWGLDHGTWSILVKMFPAADIPVVQLSVDATKSLDEHMALGAALAPLRDEGVLILGSGNVVHNLGQIQWNMPGHGTTWASSFDQAAQRIMTTEPSALGQLESDPSYRLAVPTPDHFLPLAYVAGLAAAAGTTASTLLEGCEMGSLSMTSYVVH
jgi:4,5-DOPA dioxygenase extradiol